MAVGIALEEGRIASLDTQVARYPPEWDGEPRGRITLRQLLERPADWKLAATLVAFCTDRHGTTCATAGLRHRKGRAHVVRQRFRIDCARFPLEHEPGGFYNASPANTQLAAVIIERATGMPSKITSTSACGVRRRWDSPAALDRAPACRQRTAAGVRRRADSAARIEPARYRPRHRGASAVAGLARWPERRA
jgi:hypothetical protein